MTRTAVDLHPHRGSGPIDPSPGEPPERLTVKPWWDSRLALVGVRPDDPYVERFWLAIVGPSTVVLLRRFTRGLDEHPEGFRVGLLETSLAMGLGRGTGRNAPISRTLARAETFGLMRRTGEHGLQVRTHLPVLSARQVRQLPPVLRRVHADWVRIHRTDRP